MSTNSYNIEKFIKCVNFCAIKHTNQRRLNSAQTPYINHPIGVAHILTAEAGIVEEEIIMAALLHDTIEDTDTTMDEITREFGPSIANIVMECTDDKSLPKGKRKELQIINASKSSREAKLVKLADKLYNLRDLKKETPVGWTQERIDEYFIWAHKVIDGLRGVNKALEEKLDDILK